MEGFVVGFFLAIGLMATLWTVTDHSKNIKIGCAHYDTVTGSYVRHDTCNGKEW